VAAISGEHEGLSLCPRCGGPSAEYHYRLEAIVGVEKPVLKVSYRLECSVCGYTEKMKASMPLIAAYKLRHLMEPGPKITIEKMWLAHAASIKSAADSG